MNPQEAQQKLACTILSSCERVKPYFWKLKGDDPECICHFLGIACEEVKKLMRLCGVFYGDDDRISTGNFEMLITRIGIYADHSTYKHQGKKHKHIKLGAGKTVVKPQNMYNAKGELTVKPLAEENYFPLRTKKQKGFIPSLLDSPARKKLMTPSPSKPIRQGDDLSPRGTLMKEIERHTEDAARTKGGRMSSTSRRRFHRLIKATTETEAIDWLLVALEKLWSAR